MAAQVLEANEVRPKDVTVATGLVLDVYREAGRIVIVGELDTIRSHREGKVIATALTADRGADYWRTARRP